VETDFWIGLAIALPLSIVANLATPAAQNWLANRNKRLDDKRQQQRTEMDRLIQDLRTNTMAYANFLSTGFMRLLLLAVLIFLGVSVPFYIPAIYFILYPEGEDTPALDGAIYFVSIFLLLGLLVSFMNTSRKIRRVMRAIVLDMPSNEL